MESLAFSLASAWSQWVWPLLQFIIGLGLVVFVHELGHFLVARWVGIKVERFAVGFGPRLFGYKTEETDYCICLFPLGGYVKMLGQEDFAPLEEDQKPDPRSYAAKSVGQRFAVISAGVIMNVIFAALLFLVVGMIGKDFPAPVAGDVLPESPAAEARISWTATDTAPNGLTPPGPVGIKPGDRIVRFGGKEINRFDTIFTKTVLASKGETFDAIVQRRKDGVTWTGKTTIGVKWMTIPGMNVNAWAVGIETPTSRKIEAVDEPDSPLKVGDRVLAVAGTPVEDYWDLHAICERHTGEPFDVKVLRDGNQVNVRLDPQLMLDLEDVHATEDGRRIYGAYIGMVEKGKKLRFRTADGNEVVIDADKRTLPEPLEILGMSPRLKVPKVLPDNPADKAGLRRGDVLVSYGDRANPTLRQFIQVNNDAAGGKTTAVVLRDGKTKTLTIEPKQEGDRGLVGVPLPFHYENDQLIIAGVREGTAAATAEQLVRPGDRILKVNGQDVTRWEGLYARMLELRGQPVTLTVQRGSETFDTKLTDSLSPEQFDPEHYLCRLGVAFGQMSVNISFDNPIAAIGWGAEEAFQRIIEAYMTLRGLMTGDVSHRAVSGPVGMGGMAIQIARRGPIDFLYFMAFISAVLAVMNFLPIPVVDGGHAVFLIVEKIRGKPLPVKLMNIIQIAGLVLLGSLFLLLTWQDIAKLAGF
ncbi:MAG: site-2 protease family protein [Phycisphaerae bacterium]